jgi:hypothetical protein
VVNEADGCTTSVHDGTLLQDLFLRPLEDYLTECRWMWSHRKRFHLHCCGKEASERADKDGCAIGWAIHGVPAKRIRFNRIVEEITRLQFFFHSGNVPRFRIST